MIDYYSLSLPLDILPDREPSPLLVLPKSSLRHRKYVERFALHFKRELHYDFPQFEASETKDKPNFVPWEAFLFHAPAYDICIDEEPIKSRFFGACCFRWREWLDKPNEWCLDWVWFHPYFRARGHLKNAWPMFLKRYKKFGVEKPLSCGMEMFLRKVEGMQSN